ncbi:hypothetical protein D3C85_1361700 [compost metagenome]
MLVDNEVTVTAQLLGVHRLPWPVMCDELSPPVTTILANPPTRQPANPPTRQPPATRRMRQGSRRLKRRLLADYEVVIGVEVKPGLVNQTPLADAGNILGHPCVTVSPPIFRGGLFVS